MRKIREILRLRHERGLSHRAIAQAVHVGAATVSEYLAKAAAEGLEWPLPEEVCDAELEQVLFPRPPASSERELPDFAAVHEELSRHRELTLLQLWVEYAEDNPRAYRYSRYCELYQRWKRKLKPTMRQRHRAGEKTFVDFSGKKPHLVDPKTGELEPVELFVAALGASNYTYAEATQDQSLESWVAAHERMSSYFRGSSEIWVPDNLKSGVVWADRYEPGINRTYKELASHYGAVVIPARVARPKDKAKVESAVQLAQRWILAVLRHHTFFSLSELNEAIRNQLERLNARPMQKLGASRRELYERVDRPALKPLPIERYELARWKPCTVNIDYHVEVDGSHYSVPYQLIDEKVEVRTTASMVEVVFKEKRVASHRRRKTRGELVTEPEHMPLSHRRHLEWTPSRLTHWASGNGPATGRLVSEILKRRPHPEQGFRASLGLMRLSRRFSGERLEAACKRALALGSYSYRTVKNILSAGLDRLVLEEDAESRPRPAHENIRGAEYYDAGDARC
ncbi:MAG: IS21 family transposase [Rhodothermales bacterium]|nr:IS21 family transposase [Rhodothermales bacterium]